jgi:hypothetical protein
MEVTVATTTTRNPLLYIAAGAAAFIGLLVVIVIASGPAVPASESITGTFTLKPDFALPGLGGCTGMGKYEDIAQGTAVAVLNQAGGVVGSAGLEYSYYDTTKGGAAVCYFTFTVTGASGAYSVRVGNHPPERIYGDTVALESHFS